MTYCSKARIYAALVGLAAGGPLEAAPRASLTDDTAAVAAANRAASLGPGEGAYRDGMATYPFDKGRIYRVVAMPGRVTDIALETGEALIAVASGDTLRWIIGDTTSGSGPQRQVHILVKPVAPALSTNLVITTDRRSYHLLLRSDAHAGMTALAWRYPRDALLAILQAPVPAGPAHPETVGIRPQDLHFDYAISGDKVSWRPLRAFDDGRQTFIEFPPSIVNDEAPPLFVIGPGKKPELVNYRVEGRFYVVDRIFPVAELRLGTRDQQVVRITRTGAAPSKSAAS